MLGRAVEIAVAACKAEIGRRVAYRLVGISRAVIMGATSVGGRVDGIDDALVATAPEATGAFIIREALPAADHLLGGGVRNAQVFLEPTVVVALTRFA